MFKFYHCNHSMHSDVVRYQSKNQNSCDHKELQGKHRVTVRRTDQLLSYIICNFHEHETVLEAQTRTA